MAKFLRVMLGALGGLLLVSCGGNSSSLATVPPPTTLTLSAPTLVLAVNDPGLNAALTGHARTITVTNAGAHAAQALSVSVLPALPADALFNTNCGAVLAAGSSCQITVTPGQTPSAAPMTIAPTDAMLRVQGVNTAAVSATVRILGYGNVHEGGYVYSLDDTTPATGSVGGKVWALSAASTGEIWGPNGALTVENFVDSRIATQAIVDQFPGQASAAKTCRDSRAGGYTDWYLPVLCEMSGCTTQPMGVTLRDSYFASAASRQYWVADSRDPGNMASTVTAVCYSRSGLGGSALYLVSRSDLLETRCMRYFSG